MSKLSKIIKDFGISMIPGSVAYKASFINKYSEQASRLSENKIATKEDVFGDKVIQTLDAFFVGIQTLPFRIGTYVYMADKFAQGDYSSGIAAFSYVSLVFFGLYKCLDAAVLAEKRDLYSPKP